jgi:hypothetical protein
MDTVYTFDLLPGCDGAIPHKTGKFMMFSSDNRDCIVTDSPLTRNSMIEKESVLKETRIRFQCSPYPELHDIHCDFHEGVLTMRGCVSSFFLKQIAQTIVFSIESIDAIENCLTVVERLA